MDDPLQNDLSRTGHGAQDEEQIVATPACSILEARHSTPQSSASSRKEEDTRKLWDKAKSIFPRIQVDRSGRGHPWASAADRLLNVNENDEPKDGAGNRDTPIVVTRDRYPSGGSNSRPFERVRASTPPPNTIEGQFQAHISGSDQNRARLFARVRRAASRSAEGSPTLARKRKAHAPLYSEAPEEKRPREDGNFSLQELAESMSLDRYFRAEDDDNPIWDGPRFADEYDDRTARDDDTVIETYSDIEEDLQYIRELPIIIIDDSPKRMSARKPTVSSPLNPYREEVPLKHGIWHAYAKAFRHTKGTRSAHCRPAVVPRRRTECIQHECVPLGVSPNEDPRRYPRCWACRHESHPVRVWRIKASERWIKQSYMNSELERQFQQEENYGRSIYDDDYGRDEIDYSEAYA